MPVTGTARPLTPAERSLRALWAARLPFVAFVSSGVAAAAAITALQPRIYASQAILSIKPPPSVVAEARAGGKPVLSPDGQLYDANNPDRQSGPGRYAPRLTAPGLVTLAARDAGILGPNESLDDRQASRLVTAERIEGADLIALVASQPTPEAAHKLATAIVARGLDANRREEAALPARALLDEELKKASDAMDEAEQIVARSSGGGAGHADAERERLELNLARERYAAVRKRMADLDLIIAERQRQLQVVDAPTLPLSPASPRLALNLSIGFAFGVLAGSAYVTLRSMLS